MALKELKYQKKKKLQIIHKGRENKFWFTRKKLRDCNDFIDKLYH